MKKEIAIETRTKGSTHFASSGGGAQRVLASSTNSERVAAERVALKIKLGHNDVERLDPQAFGIEMMQRGGTGAWPNRTNKWSASWEEGTL